MNTTALLNHNEALKARYGIKNLNAFRRSARRYECKLSWLNLLAACDARRSEWAAKQFETVSESARKNLSKYCRNYKLFLNDLYINRDPRGYALKLEIENNKLPNTFLCHAWRDWGSCYIIAPDLKEM